MLPIDAQARKERPVYSGFVCYFPDAMAEVAHHSYVSNEQHNPGESLHWNRAKSTDEMDAMCRHVVDTVDRGQTLDEQIVHQRAIAWRAMARLQKLCERRDENSKTQKIAPKNTPSGSSKVYPVRPDCTGDPKCLTDAGLVQQRRSEDRLVLKETGGRLLIKHDEGLDNTKKYILSLNEGWDGNGSPVE